MRKRFSSSRGAMIQPFPNNSNNTLPDHGGDLAWAAARYRRDIADWLDLSTGINPTPYALPLIPQQAWNSLPSRDREQEVLTAARAYYRVPSEVSILALPGTQSAIQLLPRILPTSNVDILTPTYSEHAICWSRAGHRVREIERLHEIDLSTRIVVLVHPNNPDGRTYPLPELIALAATLHQRGGWLIVDEAFADTDPDISLAPVMDEAGPIVLKSFGKFFGLAGLRLGFLAGPDRITQIISAELGPWAVSGIALEVGAVALGDAFWIAATRARLRQSARRLTVLLTENDLPVIGGTDLFCLVETRNAPTVFHRLCEAGILCRIFSGRDTVLRFGLPGTETDWSRLAAALAEWRK